LEKKRAVVEDRERYTYPLPPNGHLSCLSSGAALPHPPRQQKMEKVELTILAEV
jgi:hypothetical protein